MSQWGSDVNANKLKKSYIKGFLDISGGNLIAQNSSTIMIMSAGADIPALQIKTDRFSVNTGTSTVDISYSTFASLGTLGVSYENSTAELIQRTKYLSTGTNVNGNVTLIGNALTPSNFSDLQVYGNIYAYNGTSSYGYSMSPLGYMFMAGDASINGSVRIGGDISLNGRLIGYGDISLNGNLRTSGNVNVGTVLYVANDSSLNGNVFIARDLSLNGNTRLGSRLTVVADTSLNGNVKLGSGINMVAINKDISSGFALDVSGIVNMRAPLYALGDVSLGQKLFVNGDASLNGNIAVGIDVSVNRALYVSGRALLSGDVSLNRNTKLGAGANSVAINKDISSGFALDISGITNIRAPLYATADVSMSQKLFVSGDVSINGNLTASRTTIVGDISINANTRFGTGINSIAINKDISSGFALDVSGITNLRAPLYTLADVSLGQKLFVSGDVSINGNLSAGRTRFNNDVSLNANARLGTGINSIAINKDISSGFALDVSGITILRAPLYTLADVSLGQKLYVAGDVSINGNLTAGRTSIVGDISLSGNVKLGSGSSLVAINKDISSGYAFDVSGITNLRAPLYALADVSMGQKLFVAGDVSLNGNIAVGLDVSVNRSLYVTGRALFSGDVSLNGNTRTYSLAINKDISTGVALDVSGLSMFNGNVDIGTGSHLVAINKDVSAGYHLDISGYTRSTNMDVNGTLYTRKIEPFNPALSGAIVIGSTLVGPDGSIKIGSIIGNTYVDIGNTTIYGGTFRFNEPGYILGSSGDILLNIGSTQTTGNLLIGTHNSRSALINIGTGTSSSGAINIATGSSGTSVTTIGRNSAIRIANGTSTTVDISATGLLTLRGSSIRAVSDISANANTKLGSGANSVAINKDISSGYALDVSGITNIRGALYVAGDVSMNNTLAVGLDVSVNRSLYVAGSTLLSGDVSLNGKLSFNGVAGTIANSDNSQPMTFASGTTLGAVNIGTDQTGGIMNIGTADNRSTAINIGTGATNSGTVNILTGSGTTGKLVVGGDVSLNGNTIINQDLSVNRALFVAGRSLFSGDVSLNGNTRLNNSLAINKDISAGITLDVSGLSMFSGNVDIGTGSHLVAINKDVSDGYHLDISGNMRVSGTAIINNIDSLQSNIAITIGGTDRSGSINIGTVGSTSRNISIGGSTGVTYIKGSSVRIRDTGNGQLTVGRIESDTTADSTTALILCGPNTSGSARMMDGYGSTGTVTIGRNNAIRIANGTSTTVDISATGLLTLRGSGISAVSDISINANTKLGLGANSVAINKDISSVYALDVSGNTNLRGALYVAGSALFSGDVSCNGKLSFNGVPGTIANSDNSQPMTFASGTTLGAVNIGTDQTGGIMNIGTADNRSTAINIGTGATNSGTVNILTGSGTTGKLVVGGDVSLNGNATMNQDLSVNRALFVGGRTLFSGDVSLNGNTRLNNSLAINKDISAGIALDVSGLSMFSGNVDIGTGSNLVAINKDVSAGYHLDISGNTRSTNLDVNGTLLTQKIEPFNPALNGAIVIGSTLVGPSGSVKIGNTLSNTYVDIGNTTINGGALRFNEAGNIYCNSANSALSIASTQSSGVLSIGTFATRSAAINIGTGTSNSGTISIATGTSGTSVTTIGRNNAIRIANGTSTTVDISATGLLTLRGSGISAVSDISINANTKLGSGANSVAINKDISGVYALDVSGITNLRGPLYSLGDVSFSQKLFVAGDASINGNLLVKNAIAINKDISSQYVLDVNGVSQFRGDVNVGGSFTINGVPVNASSLTGNVQVGSNNGFVTVNKPQFYADPSLLIYYNFDTTINSGTAVQNIANPGTYDLSLSTFTGGITGMIDTVKYKYGVASLKNDSGTPDNKGANTQNVTVSNTMSFSFWMNKVTATSASAPDFDRIFELTNNTVPGSTNESDTIGLDISASGAIIPVITKGQTSIIGETQTIQSYTISNSLWNHFCWVINNLQATLYLNGSIILTSTLSDQIYRTTPSNLLLWYQMENNANNSGQMANMNGTLTGATYSSSTFKKGAYSLVSTGSTQYISVPNFTLPVTGVTASVWYARTSIATSDIINFGTNQLLINMFGTGSLGSSYNIVVGLSGSNQITYPTTLYSAWIHLAITVTYTTNNTSITKLYVNGSLVSTSSASGTYPTSTLTNNKIGQHAGYTDDFRLYNTILSDSDITAIYNEANTIDSYNRSLMIIAGSTMQLRDFSGNIDDFRYYKDKALNEAEIFQLSNNRYYNLDVSGGLIANGPSVIYEDIGSKASANAGTLTLLHGDPSGSSSILFKSVNDGADYGYIQYDENVTGSTGYNYGLMTIGIENDASYGTTVGDRVSIFPSGGRGFVGVNTKTPLVSLDVSGQARIYEGAGTLASTAGGSFTLEHAATGGTSSIVFKGPTASTGDYAYVQYTDASTVMQSLLKYDFSSNNPATLTGGATIASTGTTTTAIQAKPNDNSLNWYSNSTSINGITPAYCISFNQTNIAWNNTTSRVNYMDLSGTMPYSSSFSTSMWLYPSGMIYDQSYGRYFVLNLAQNTDTFNAALEMYIEHVLGGNGKLYVILNEGTGGFMYTSVGLTLNQWHHVAFTYNSITQTGQLYYNGSKSSITTSGTGYAGIVLKAYNVLTLGASWRNYNGSTNASRGFRGQMAFVNIFDRGLSDGDVAYLYNNPSYNVLTNPERGLMTIGIENDTGNINGDRIVLWPGAGTGTVGINTRTPIATLDVSGSINATGLIQGQRFNSTSDYRVKSDIRDLDASFTVDALRPVTYKFVSNGMSDIGFIAHEVQEQYPYLVQGEKDGLTTQSLNYNGIIGILTRELKELKATVMDLQLTVKDLQLIIQNQSDQSK